MTTGGIMAKEAVRKIGLRATAGHRILSFGLVNVGVSLAPALDASARIRGKRVHPDTLEPVRQVYLDATGTEVKPVTAYAYGDHFVQLDENEVPKLDSSSSIELVANLESAPAEWVETTYLCWPTDETQDATFSLLASYLKTSGRSLVGETVANGTTKVLAVSWSHEYTCVIAQLLAFHEQVRWENVAICAEGTTALAAPDEKMQAMAATIFEQLPDEFEWEAVRDEYGEALAAAIAQKGQGAPVAASQPSARVAPAPDLLAALEASLQETPKAKSKKKGKVTA